MAMLATILIFIGLCTFLIWFFMSHDRGAKEPRSALIEAFGFGALALVLALVAEEFIIGSKGYMTALTAHQGSLQDLWVLLQVGIIEELAKFLPLALFIHKRPYFNEYTDGVIYFSLAGLAFSLGENILYTIQGGPSVGLTRAVFLLFFHAATSGIIGFYYAKHKLKPEPITKTIGVLILVMVMHGVYDFGVSSGVGVFVVVSLMLTVLLNTGLFLYFNHASELDQAAGLSAQGVNRFCSSCGVPNPRRTLYCEQCGHLT